jgi:hypothetical protein
VKALISEAGCSRTIPTCCQTEDSLGLPASLSGTFKEHLSCLCVLQSPAVFLGLSFFPHFKEHHESAALQQHSVLQVRNWWEAAQKWSLIQPFQVTGSSIRG